VERLLGSALGHDWGFAKRGFANWAFANWHLANRGLLVNWLRVRQICSGGNTCQAKQCRCNDQKFEHIRSLKVSNSAVNELWFCSRARLTVLRLLVKDGYFLEERCINAASSPRVKCISGSKNFRSPPQKEFYNNIGTNRTYRGGPLMSVVGAKPEVVRRDPEHRFPNRTLRPPKIFI
jgi:hypothetical protein